MKHLLHLCLFALSVLAVIACGGDEPMPVGPNEPEEQDTIQTDTVQEDTTEADTAEKFVFECSISPRSELLTCNLSSDVKETDFTWDGRWNFNFREKEFYYYKEDYKYVTASLEGYVSQRVLLHTPFSRMMDFAMQPTPGKGTTILDINRASGDMAITNSEENQERSGMTVLLTLPEGCRIEGGKERDIVVPTAFVPAASPVENLTVGGTMSAAVAGFTVGTSDLTLNQKVTARLTLPYPVDGYSLKATTPDEWSIPAEVEGNTVTVDIPVLDEWAIEMEAKVVDIAIGREYIAQGESQYCPYYQDFAVNTNTHFKKRGFEPESALRTIEERFLLSLFGATSEAHYHANQVVFTIFYNAPCTVVYDIWQEVHHLTFEAAGRQFRAKVYGDTYVELVSATQKTLEN